MNSVQDDSELPETGCPIRKSPDQSLFSGSPKLIAANHVLLRLLAPRHPPYALSSLTTFANTTQRKLQFVTRIQLSKNIHGSELLNRHYPKERLVNSDPFIQNHSLTSSQQPGGADRDRTDDLRLAKPALSQLSYSPGRSGS